MTPVLVGNVIHCNNLTANIHGMISGSISCIPMANRAKLPWESYSPQTLLAHLFLKTLPSTLI